MKKYIRISIAIYIVMWIAVKLWTMQIDWRESEYVTLVAIISVIVTVNTFVAAICSFKYVSIFINKQLEKIKK